ncbi:MAG: deoxyribodipyrimidine photo-lyase, partial [Pseudomonadota bacterium]
MNASAAGRPRIHWFRNDLRLADNPSLAAAAADGAPLLCFYVLDEDGPWALGGAQRWWLHHSLARLGEAIAERGGALILRRGPGAESVLRFAAEVDAAGVSWNRLYDPASIARDKTVKAALRADGRAADSYLADALLEPWALKTGSGRPYQVFTPFGRAARAALEPLDAPQPAPVRLDAPAQTPPSDRLEDWGLLPTKPDWAGGLRAAWTPGEAGAEARLADFVKGPVSRYGDQRDLPAVEGTSKLSPHLRWGEISPRQVWTAAAAKPASDKFLTELLWREFARNLLFHFPDLPNANLKSDFDAFPWGDDAGALDAWRAGRTGYPI